MKVTPEMMAKLKQCQSAEEIVGLAKQKNVTVTMDKAREVFELLNSEDLSDEMMEEIIGGFWILPKPSGGVIIDV